MTTKREILSEIEYLQTLKTMVETYQEVAAVRMQKLRSSVLATRSFLYDINAIFQQVKLSYKKEMEILMKEKHIKDYKKISFLAKNGKTVFVVFSSNTGLYGDIVRRTFNLFAESFKKEKGDAGKTKFDVTIVGRTGNFLFQEQFPNTPFTYFDLSDTDVARESLQKLIEHIISYEKVLAFCGQYQSIISQLPTAISISGDRLPWEGEMVEIKYFFEPSLEKIMEFFEKEIFASIFEQALYEGSLAKFASRMVSLDSVADNTKNKLKQMIALEERIRHQIMNKKQNEMFASRGLWEYG